MKLKQFVVGLIAASAVAGCGGDSSGPPPDPAIAAAGSYSMMTYNGSALPALFFSNAAGTIEITAGTEVLRADHSYDESWSTRTTYNAGYGCGCVQNSTDAVEGGNFDLVGTTITFHPSDGSAAYTGAVSNGVLTYTVGSLSVKYQK